jgi:phenylacetate-coenzyme A ligase PaaK-like adenylate-forming protein
MLPKSKYINLARLLRNEYRSLDELLHLQSVKLKRLVNHAYSTVSFYKKLFDECGLRPEEIQSIEDITKIPVIDKKLMAQNSYENLISKRYNIKNLIRVKTAGSNGDPYMFYIDRSFDQFRKAQFLRPYITNGKRPFDRSVSLSVTKSAPSKWYHHFGLMPESRIFTGEDLNRQIEILKNIKPDIIQGYGSVLSLISNKIIEDNISITKPRLIFTDSELLMPEMRENIEKAFENQVLDIYGTFETDNIAYECSKHEGYHIAIDSIIMEYLKDTRPAENSGEGEIVVTVLNNSAMPFIRYNLHDIGSFINKSCSCGRTFPLMNQVKGRASDYLLTEDGRKFSVFNLGRFASLAPNVYEYQIIQEDFNSFTLLIVPNKSYNNEGEIIIKTAIKKLFPKAKININLVSSIKREHSGKFKAFKSQVNLSDQNI